ncbi:MAG: hypothetical protein WB729_02195 [Candidatus Sulfotelmatobacter sp.]
MKQSTRPPKTISEQLRRHLNLYGTAASASGVSLLALAQPANAKVVYTPAHVTIAPNSTYNLDLNHDGIADFAIKQHSYPGYSATLYVGPNANGVVARSGAVSCACDSALAFQAGAVIGPARQFVNVDADLAKVKKIASSVLSFGLWRNENNKYLALVFKINGETHYGWARFSVQSSYAKGVVGFLTGYAYETIPNKPIRAGQQAGGTDTSFDQKGSLGALAAGVSR